MNHPLIATFNTGSSSLKFSAYELLNAGIGARVIRGSLRDLGVSMSVDIEGQNADQEQVIYRAVAGKSDRPGALIPLLVETIEALVPEATIVRAGHRIVHGADITDGPCRAESSRLERLEDLAVFAPDHQSHNLAGVRALLKKRPDIFQTLSFDTAFHQSISEVARAYALPKQLRAQGLKRYGFHGLSYKWIASASGAVFSGHPHRKIIALHLGSGASLCAIKDGESVATSMGLTPNSGVPMATRSGDVDPGLILHLIDSHQYKMKEISRILNHRSGLAGLSGISGNLEELTKSDAPAAKFAIDVYVHQIVREVGAMMTALSGVEALVFTGGVGENADNIRRLICEKLYWIGAELDRSLNETGLGRISSKRSEIMVAVIPADEEAVIAAESASVS